MVVQAEILMHRATLAAAVAVQVQLVVLALAARLRVALAAQGRSGLTGLTMLAAAVGQEQVMLLGA